MVFGKIKTRFSSKNQTHSQLEKKNSIGISVFGYENNVSKKYYGGKHVKLLLIGKGEKKHYVLNKDFNTFIYHNTLHSGRKHFLFLLFASFLEQQKN